MDHFILICEIIIGIAGIFTFINADAFDERVHGLLIIVLSLHAICEHFFGEEGEPSMMALFASCILAVLFIVLFIRKQIKKPKNQNNTDEQ